MLVEVGFIYKSPHRHMGYPDVRHLRDGRLEFMSRPPAFIAPLTPEEKEIFIAVVANENFPTSLTEVPEPLVPLTNRMRAVGKLVYPDYQSDTPSANWKVYDRANYRAVVPHPDSALSFTLSEYHHRHRTLPDIRMSVTGSLDGMSPGLLFYPGLYRSDSQGSWGEVGKVQALKKTTIKTPELFMIGFTQCDIHSSPAFSSRRGNISVWL